MITGGRVIRRNSGGGGGLASPEWALLSTLATSLDQGSGTSIAPDDSTSIGTTGTGFDADSGQGTVICGTHITGVDGYREGPLFWSIPLVDLWPGFDPASHVLEFGLEFVTFSRKVNGLGIFLGLGDRDPGADFANMAGSAFGVRAQNATNYQLYEMRDTLATSGVTVGLVDEIRARWTALEVAGGGYRYQGAAYVASGGSDVGIPGAYSVGDLEFQSDTAEHRLIVGAFHLATTDLAGESAVFNVYAKRSPRGDLPFS